MERSMRQANTKLTTVMYHYVRPLAVSSYPRLKALELANFEAQLDYLQSAYNIISPFELSASLMAGTPLPEKSCLLTFDDGYTDHYQHVYPVLAARSLTGLFFAPKCSLIERKPLEVNKVQFILASCENPYSLAAELDKYLLELGGHDIKLLRENYFAPNRFDGPEVAYFKRLLQHVLQPNIRRSVIDNLFNSYVTSDISEFTEDLYLTVEQAKEMREAGNEFGGHGSEHLWHAMASEGELNREITGSVDALTEIGAPVSGGFYSYPFGSYDDNVCKLVSDAGFQIGFTVEPTLFSLFSGDRMRISRLDTNDLPIKSGSQTDHWLSATEVLEG